MKRCFVFMVVDLVAVLYLLGVIENVLSHPEAMKTSVSLFDDD